MSPAFEWSIVNSEQLKRSFFILTIDYSPLTSKVLNVEVSDTTGDAKRFVAGQIKNLIKIAANLQ